MIAEAILCTGFGLAYLLAPQYLADEYLTDKAGLTTTTRLVSWQHGSLLITVGVVQWLCRNARPSLARYALLFMPLLANVLVVGLGLYALLTGLETNVAWAVIAIAGTMAAWAGGLLLKERGLHHE